MKLTVLLKPAHSVISPEQEAEEGDIQSDMEEIDPSQKTDLNDPEVTGVSADEPDMPTGRIANRWSQRARQSRPFPGINAGGIN